MGGGWVVGDSAGQEGYGTALHRIKEALDRAKKRHYGLRMSLGPQCFFEEGASGIGLDESFAWLEFGCFFGSDFDGGSGAGIAAYTGGTLVDAKGAKTNEGYFLTFVQLLFDNIDIGVEGFSGIDFADARFLSHCGN